MKRDQALDTVKALTMDDRNKTHGDPVLQFEKGQRIKAAVGHQQNPNLLPAEIECIEMICTKLSRWTSGKREHTSVAKWAEHPLDIIGYASIAVEAIYAGEPSPKTGAGDVFDDLEKLRLKASPFVGPGQVARPAVKKENPSEDR